MVSILPQVVAAAPVAFAAAVEKASPWAAELLVGCFTLISELPPAPAAVAPSSSPPSSSSFTPAPLPPSNPSSSSSPPSAAAAFYDALFEPLGADADAVRATLLNKQVLFFLCGFLGQYSRPPVLVVRGRNSHLSHSASPLPSFCF